MENITNLFSSSPHGWAAGVEENPYLAAGPLLAYALIGLANYTWAFWTQRSRLGVFKEAVVLSLSGQHGRLRGVQNIHSMFITVFFMDILNAITSVILGIEFARSTCGSGLTCAYVFIVWYLSRCIGVILHLLVVLLCLHFLCHLQWRANLHYVFISAVVLMLLFVPVYIFVSQVAIFGLGTLTFGLAFAIIAKCTSTAPPLIAIWKKPFVIVAMLTFLFVFVPAFILQCLMINAANHSEPIHNFVHEYWNALLYTNAQVYMDGLLFRAVLQLLSEEQLQQLQLQQQPQGQGFENHIYDISTNAQMT